MAYNSATELTPPFIYSIIMASIFSSAGSAGGEEMGERTARAIVRAGEERVSSFIRIEFRIWVVVSACLPLPRVTLSDVLRCCHGV